MNVSPNNKSDESDNVRIKNSPAPVMTSSEEYEDNFNYTLNMIHPLVFTPAESRPHLTSANQESNDSQNGQPHSLSKEIKLVMVDDQLGS